MALSPEERSHIKDLLEKHRANLRIFQFQLVSHGGKNNAPAKLINDIDDTHKEILELEAKLNAAEAPPQPTFGTYAPPRPRSWEQRFAEATTALKKPVLNLDGRPDEMATIKRGLKALAWLDGERESPDNVARAQVQTLLTSLQDPKESSKLPVLVRKRLNLIAKQRSKRQPAAESPPAEAMRQYDAALTLLCEGKYAEANHAFAELEKKHPNVEDTSQLSPIAKAFSELDGLCERAHSELSHHRYRSAMGILKQIIETHPGYKAQEISQLRKRYQPMAALEESAVQANQRANMLEGQRYREQQNYESTKNERLFDKYCALALLIPAASLYAWPYDSATLLTDLSLRSYRIIGLHAIEALLIWRIVDAYAIVNYVKLIQRVSWIVLAVAGLFLPLAGAIWRGPGVLSLGLGVASLACAQLIILLERRDLRKYLALLLLAAAASVVNLFVVKTIVAFDVKAQDLPTFGAALVIGAVCGVLALHK